MLLPRLATGILGAAFLLTAVYVGSLPYFFIILGIVLLGVREFYFMAEETGYPCYKSIGTLASGLIVCSVYLNGVSFGQVTDNQVTSAFISFVLLWITIRSLIKGPADTSLSEWAITFFGMFYVGWSLSHLLLIRDLRPGGREITFMFFAMVWAADVSAYVIGSRWGRHKVAPSVSPKKSWEGLIAGLVGSVLAGLLMRVVCLSQQLKLTEVIILSFVTGVIAFVSDLGESVLKRGAGVKDSSHLLPGHGGVLDRFDSFFLAAPVYYYYWAFLKR